jgi:hypothetical protein
MTCVFFSSMALPEPGKPPSLLRLSPQVTKTGSLWAQFFSRNHDGVRNPKSIFPSISHKLVNGSPDSMASLAIHNALQVDCIIPDFLVDSQATEPFAKPMKAEQVSHP